METKVDECHSAAFFPRIRRYKRLRDQEQTVENEPIDFWVHKARKNVEGFEIKDGETSELYKLFKSDPNKEKLYEEELTEGM